MTEHQAELMLAALARIEMLLMHIANNTSDAIPPMARSGMRTHFFTSTPTTSDETITPVK